MNKETIIQGLDNNKLQELYLNGEKPDCKHEVKARIVKISSDEKSYVYKRDACRCGQESENEWAL